MAAILSVNQPLIKKTTTIKVFTKTLQRKFRYRFLANPRAEQSPNLPGIPSKALSGNEKTMSNYEYIGSRLNDLEINTLI